MKYLSLMLAALLFACATPEEEAIQEILDEATVTAQVEATEVAKVEIQAAAVATIQADYTPTSTPTITPTPTNTPIPTFTPTPTNTPTPIPTFTPTITPTITPTPTPLLARQEADIIFIALMCGRHYGMEYFTEKPSDVEVPEMLKPFSEWARSLDIVFDDGHIASRLTEGEKAEFRNIHWETLQNWYTQTKEEWSREGRRNFEGNVPCAKNIANHQRNIRHNIN